jgi:hypothetical protein
MGKVDNTVEYKIAQNEDALMRTALPSPVAGKPDG